MSSSSNYQSRQKSAKDRSHYGLSSTSFQRTANNSPGLSARNYNAGSITSRTSDALTRNSLSSPRSSVLNALETPQKSALPRFAAVDHARNCATTAGTSTARPTNSNRLESKQTASSRIQTVHTRPYARRAPPTQPSRSPGPATKQLSAQCHSAMLAQKGLLAPPLVWENKTPILNAQTTNEKDFPSVSIVSALEAAELSKLPGTVAPLPAIPREAVLSREDSSLEPSDPYPLVEGELPTLRTRASQPKLWSDWFDEMKQSLSNSKGIRVKTAGEPRSVRSTESSTKPPVWMPDSPEEIVAKREETLARAAAGWTIRDSDGSSFGSSSETCSSATNSASTPTIARFASDKLPAENYQHNELAALQEYKQARFAFLRRRSTIESIVSDGTADPDDLLPLPEDGSPFFNIIPTWPENRRKLFHPRRFGAWEKRVYVS